MSAVTGLAMIKRAAKRLAKRYEDATLAAVWQKGFEIMNTSDQRVPVDKGILKNSHYVAPPDQSGIVELGYGTNYGLAVHERVEVFHEVGGPLFLKSAFDEHTATYLKDVAELTKDNFERGVRPGAGGAAIPQKPKADVER